MEDATLQTNCLEYVAIPGECVAIFMPSVCVCVCVEYLLCVSVYRLVLCVD